MRLIIKRQTLDFLKDMKEKKNCEQQWILLVTMHECIHMFAMVLVMWAKGNNCVNEDVCKHMIIVCMCIFIFT